jgi:hypothetical protein
MKVHAILYSLLIAVSAVSCHKTAAPVDEKMSQMGSVEVTATLEEIRGEFVDKANYDYAFVMKYKVKEVHRGKIDGDTIYVAHYNPQKPRAAAADARVPDIGGNVQKFRAGDVHRMALEAPIDDFYMGGIINRYFEEYKGVVYWAVRTNEV